MKRPLLLATLFSISTILEALPQDWPSHYPDWWWDGDPSLSLIDTSRLGQPQSNQQLNQGQLLNIARLAILELDAAIPGGAGFVVADFIDSGANPDYLAPVNLGQLKAVAAPFYDRFAALGFGPGQPGWPATLLIDEGVGDNAPLYPWRSNQTPANRAMANLGQAKHLFSWEPDLMAASVVEWANVPAAWKQAIVDAGLVGDRNGDGMIDIADVFAWDDADGDGIKNINEWQWQTDPALDQATDHDPDTIGLSRYEYDVLGRMNTVNGPVKVDYIFDDKGNLESAN